MSQEYAHGSAFVSTLKSYLLKRENYEKLLNVKSAHEVVSALSGTTYGKSISGLVEEDIIIELEKKLLHDYYEIFEKTLMITPSRALYFMKTVFYKHELSTLNTILRMLAEGLSSEEAMKRIIPVGRYDHKRCETIVTAKTVQHAIGTIEESALRQSLIPLLRTYELTRSTLPLEATIERFALTKIWEQAGYLRGWDREEIRHLVGQEIDLVNMICLARAKKLGLEQSVIQEVLIPIHYFTTPSNFKVALRSPSPTDALRALTPGYYEHILAKLLVLCETEKSFSPVEIGFKRYLTNEYLTTFQGLRFHAGVILAYLNLKFYEINDLKAIAVGKANNLSADRIKQTLILHQPIISK